MLVEQKFGLRLRMIATPLQRSTAPQPCRAYRCTVLLATTIAIVGLLAAPSAMADSTDTLKSALGAARGTSCGPLRVDSAIDEVAERINRSTDDWINHTARAVPETDALPALKDIGFNADKAAILSSAAKDEGDAVKALLVEGFAKIPDCSYSSVGASATYNAAKDMILMTAVLAG